MPCFSRTCGSDPTQYALVARISSFFPHTREWSRVPLEAFEEDFVFPAHAGVILIHLVQCRPCSSFSRTRGGDPWRTETTLFLFVFFPHTRGWSRKVFFNYFWFSVFPAHAGVIRRCNTPKSYRQSFSRTRGSDPKLEAVVVAIGTFFPHTREWSQ